MGRAVLLCPGNSHINLLGYGKSIIDFARRDLDVRLRTAAVDGLNRTLLTGFLPADLVRGAGLLALGKVGFLRRAVMREGVLPHMGAPRLMQDASAV